MTKDLQQANQEIARRRNQRVIFHGKTFCLSLIICDKLRRDKRKEIS